MSFAASFFAASAPISARNSSSEAAGGTVERLADAQRPRDVDEQFLERRDADRRQHPPPFVVTPTDVTHG